MRPMRELIAFERARLWVVQGIAYRRGAVRTANGGRPYRQRTVNFSLSPGSAVTHRVTMPIRAEHRWLYPIDWEQVSGAIRFDRAGSRCERCARPHLRRVAHLGDGRWWDGDAGHWRSDHGRRTGVRTRFTLAAVRTTYVVLACAHLDHDPGNNAPANLAALCQRCHMLHAAASIAGNAGGTRSASAPSVTCSRIRG